MAFRYLMLIGPIGAGKTPIAELIGSALGIEHIILDLQSELLVDLGQTDACEQEAAMQGVESHLAYLGRFSVPLIKKLMRMHRSAVFDCGGTDFVGTSKAMRLAFKKALDRMQLLRVAAIIPYETVEQNREYFAAQRSLDKFNEYLIENPSHREIAQRCFFTHGGDLTHVADDILAWLREDDDI